jgi:DNA-directed RNA polymerase alpha subunit
MLRDDRRHTDTLLVAIDRLEEVVRLLAGIVREHESVENVDFLDRRIEDVDFGGSTTRIRNMFHNHNVDVESKRTMAAGYNVTHNGQYFTSKIETVRDLVGLSEKDLLRCYNIGRLSVDRIKGVLAAHGLSLSTYKFWADSHADEEVP